MTALDLARCATLAIAVLGIVYAIYQAREAARLSREADALNDDTRRMTQEWLQLRAEREFNHRLNAQLNIATRRKS
jgi:hypothetical protein